MNHVKQLTNVVHAIFKTLLPVVGNALLAILATGVALGCGALQGDVDIGQFNAGIQMQMANAQCQAACDADAETDAEWRCAERSRTVVLR